MENIENYLIMNGPSKFDLMASLFDDKIVSFTLVNLETGKGDEVEVNIISIANTRSNDPDFVGCSWDIEMIVLKPQAKIEKIDGTTVKKGDEFKGWYSSKTRKGNAQHTN